MTNWTEDNQQALDELLAELAEFDVKLAEDKMTDAEIAKANKLANRIEALHTLKRAWERRQVADPKLPPRGRGNGKADGRDAHGRRMVPAHVGELFTTSEAFQAYRESGYPRGGSSAVQMESLWEVPGADLETKTVPTIAANVIQPYYDPRPVQIPERQPLTLRSLVTTVPISSNLAVYVVFGFGGDGPKIVAEQQPKPENAATFDTAQAPVVTIAKWIPVTEQQLEDMSGLGALINQQLLYEVARYEEQQILWGHGQTDPNNIELTGILDPATKVPEIPDPKGRATPKPADSIIELVRMGITDITARGGAPSGVVLHPFDWEAAQLSKASDGHYLMVTMPTEAGISRLWSLPVVTSMSMANAAGERQLLVGDFIRGATLYDRRQANIAVGMINDQFIRNMRSIRAEERLAFAVNRPHFFARASTGKAP